MADLERLALTPPGELNGVARNQRKNRIRSRKKYLLDLRRAMVFAPEGDAAVPVHPPDHAEVANPTVPAERPAEVPMRDRPWDVEEEKREDNYTQHMLAYELRQRRVEDEAPRHEAPSHPPVLQIPDRPASPVLYHICFSILRRLTLMHFREEPREGRGVPRESSAVPRERRVVPRKRVGRRESIRAVKPKMRNNNRKPANASLPECVLSGNE